MSRAFYRLGLDSILMALETLLVFYNNGHKGQRAISRSTAHKAAVKPTLVFILQES